MSKPAGRGEELDRLVARARAELRDWADAPQHDPGLAIVELLAYVGDILGSYQDLIADEAYLSGPGTPASAFGSTSTAPMADWPADSGRFDDHFVASTGGRGDRHPVW